MNKKTIVTLILMANLYGQASSANEVTISKSRLQTISASELSALVDLGAVKLEGGNAIMDLNTLNAILKDANATRYLGEKAGLISPKSIPGYTETQDQNNFIKVADSLAIRFVPYGCT